MNDDFLRQLRRPPSAPFERQLRARLREQELNETSRRRPSWRLLAIALLIGGSALATATYLTLTRAPSLPSPRSTQTQTETAPPPSVARDAAPETNRFLSDTDADTDARISTYTSSSPTTQQGRPIGAARNNSQSPTAATNGSNTETSRYVSSTGGGSPALARPIRVVLASDIASLAKDTSPDSKYTQSATFEVDSADAALPTLCAEEQQDQPDIVVTSRRASKSEFRLCSRPHWNGEVLETKIGHFAIVITRAKTALPMQLSARTLRLALMKQVPAPDNSALLINNPYTHWNQIDPALEDRRIEVLGPAPNTPEFIVFASIVLGPACENNASLDPQLCNSVREDGVYTDARFDSNFVRQRLWSDPNAVAIMDYQLYAAHSDDLLGSLLPGAAPTRESIVNGDYAGARTLHAYVNSYRYRNVLKVRGFVREYLRLPAFLQQKVMIPPDGNLDSRWGYNDGPQLTEVKFD